LPPHIADGVYILVADEFTRLVKEYRHLRAVGDSAGTVEVFKKIGNANVTYRQKLAKVQLSAAFPMKEQWKQSLRIYYEALGVH
jgi:hypothetical protein